MADRLYLSLWVRGFTEHNMLRHWERLLRRFPFSRLQPGAGLRVHGVALTEPPILAPRPIARVCGVNAVCFHRVAPASGARCAGSEASCSWRGCRGATTRPAG